MSFSKFNKILTYLEAYQKEDISCPIEFTVKSEIEKYSIKQFGICISGLVKVLRKMKERKLLNIKRDYIR